MTIPQLRALSEYLLEAGWTLADDDARTSMWLPRAPEPGRKLQIVLPVTQNVDDWPERASEAVRTLAYAEGRLPEEVADDIIYGGADNVAVKWTPDAPPGQAPLPLASSAVAALHGYVVASAIALETPDLVLPSYRPSWAEAYVSKVRLGSSSGSFILSIALPLAADIGITTGNPGEDAMFDMRSQPLGRRVSNRMRAAAQTASSVAEDVAAGRRMIGSFGDATLRQAVANASELAALKALGGPESDAYQIRFTQSPLAGSRTESVRLHITSEQQRVLGAAAEFLRAREPEAMLPSAG